MSSGVAGVTFSPAMMSDIVQNMMSQQRELIDTVSEIQARLLSIESALPEATTAATSKTLKEEVVEAVLERLQISAIKPIVADEVAEQIDQSQVKLEESDHPSKDYKNQKDDQDAPPSGASAEVAQEAQPQLAPRNYASFAEELGQKAETDTLQMEESIWAAPLVLWCHAAHTGFACSLYSFALLVVNILMQSIFIRQIEGEMVQVTYDKSTASAFRLWRADIAHDMRFMTQLSQQSLAARVCAGDAGLEISQGQANANEVLGRYLAIDEFLNAEIGVIILLLCLIVWFMMVIKELENALKAILAVMHLRSQATVIKINGSDDKHTLMSVGPARAAWFVFLQTCRSVLVIILLWIGVPYLLYTIDIGEVILNTLALAFVLDIDDMIFTTFAPAHVKKLLSKFEELALPRIPSLWQLDLLAVVKVVSMSISLVLVYVLLVRAQIDILWENKDAICAGNINFVYVPNAVGSLDWEVSRRRDDEAEWADDDRVWNWPPDELAKQRYVTKLADAILSKTGTDICDASTCCNQDSTGVCTALAPDNVSWGVGKCCIAEEIKAVSIAGGGLSLAVLGGQSVDEAIGRINPFCFDVMDFWQFPGLLRGLYFFKYFGGLADAQENDDCPQGCPDFFRPYCKQGECVTPRCEDVAQYCGVDSVIGVRARQFCSQTCGCNDPNSTMLLSIPGAGCPSLCRNTQSYQAVLAALPCEDQSLNEYAEAFEQATPTFPPNLQTFAGFITFMMRSHGCKGLPMMFPEINLNSEYSALNFCGGYDPLTRVFGGPNTFPVKPLSSLCPVTCRCRKGMYGCPLTCPA